MNISRIALAGILGLLITSVADATPITVPTDSPLLLNFDFSAETPAPPYSSVFLEFLLDPYNSEPVTTTIYPELDAMGSPVYSVTASASGSDLGLNFTFDSVTYASILDGVFSVTLIGTHSTVAPFDSVLTIARATATSPSGQVRLDGEVSSSVTPVPEPASLVLLGSGLTAVIAKARRRGAAAGTVPKRG